MQSEPQQPYVYQPDPGTGEADPRIYGVAGPGAEKCRRWRYTKAEAERIVDGLILRSARPVAVLTSAFLAALGSTPEVKSAVKPRQRWA